ncbi:MAG: VOC family protein [Candidatus Methanomethylophilaceae archaeon]|nr:VOC family protein [Candidatus Methanomethylophilaceae archaeon]
MPLGDPHGGNFIYTNEGIPSGIALVTIPSRNVERSVRFYCDLLKMKLRSQTDDEAILSAGKDLVRIVRSDDAGKDTGLYLRTDSPYDLHRRLVDEGVIFVTDPKRTRLGLITSFKDDDGNIIYAIEVK